MDSRLLGRRIAAISGVTAFIAMGALTAACAKEEKKAPETTTTTTTTATTTSAPAAPAPTEKSINPTGGNLFTPPVVAPPAPTVPPGQHPGINGIP
jgi:type IV secretory pathway VirB10-like protein